MADGRDAPTPLRAALWAALGLDPDDPRAPQRIKTAVVAPDFGPAGFAALAPVVERLAANDPVADAILAANAAALAEMAAAVARRLGLPAAPVCGTGGAIDHLPRFRSRFVAALAAALPDGHWRRAGVDPCAGALAIAHDRLVGAGRG
jgi:N-acetylglucosamine kinase-like BadF-type ATPase